MAMEVSRHLSPVVRPAAGRCPGRRTSHRATDHQGREFPGGVGRQLPVRRPRPRDLGIRQHLHLGLHRPKRLSVDRGPRNRRFHDAEPVRTFRA
jgi:hypothetical protein